MVQQHNGTMHLMSSDSARPKILYVVPHEFDHPTTGSTHRTKSLYQALAMFAQVDVLVAHPKEGPKPSGSGTYPYWIEKFLSLAAKAAPYRPVPQYAAAFSESIRKGRYAAIIVRYLGTYVAIGLPKCRNMVIDFDDDPLEAYASSDLTGRHTLQSRFRRRVVSWVISYHIGKARKRAAQVWVSNPEHQEKGVNYRLVPNAAPAIVPRFNLERQNYHFAFIADMRYPPNLNALQHYCRDIHPKLIQERADAQFVACGRFHSGTIDISILDKPSINVAGFVPDISDIYATCSATIAPIISGSGTSVKVMESLAAGVPCIGTSMAYRGYIEAIREKLPFLIAEDADDFAKKMLFLGDSRREDIDDIKKACREFAEKYWSQDVVQKKLKAAVDEILAVEH